MHFNSFWFCNLIWIFGNFDFIINILCPLDLVKIQNSENSFFCVAVMTDTCLTFVTHFIRGQSPLHILGQYGKENAAAIFDLFLECMPEYPLDKPDAEGNTGM